jgi:hypothetical protein
MPNASRAAGRGSSPCRATRKLARFCTAKATSQPSSTITHDKYSHASSNGSAAKLPNTALARATPTFRPIYATCATANNSAATSPPSAAGRMRTVVLGRNQ